MGSVSAPQTQVQHSSMSSCSELYSFFLITRKPVLSVRDWLKPGTKGELAELNNPWIDLLAFSECKRDRCVDLRKVW